MDDFFNFTKIIKRYLQNIAALMRIIEMIKAELVSKAMLTMPP